MEFNRREVEPFDTEVPLRDFLRMTARNFGREQDGLDDRAMKLIMFLKEFIKTGFDYHVGITMKAESPSISLDLVDVRQHYGPTSTNCISLQCDTRDINSVEQIRLEIPQFPPLLAQQINSLWGRLEVEGRLDVANFMLRVAQEFKPE